MKKRYLLRALPALVVAALAAFGINSAVAGPPPPVTNCANVTTGAITPNTNDGNASKYINVPRDDPTLDHISSTKGTWSAGCASWSYDFYNGATLLQSGSSNLYYPTSAQEGDIITVTIWGCDSLDNCVSANDPGQANVLGPYVFHDDFNNGSGHPSTTLWDTRTDNVGSLTYDGNNLINEVSGGYVKLEAQFSDQDGDGDTAATDTDSPENSDGSTNAEDWYSSFMQSHQTLCSSGCGITVGSRYVEARLITSCTDFDWPNNELGWEFALYEGAGYGSTPSTEIDLFGERSRTNWNGAGNGDYTYAPAVQNFQKTGTWDGDHGGTETGDSVASDTDNPVAEAPDSDDGGGSDPDATSPEGTHGDVWAYAERYFTQGNAGPPAVGTKVCGSWQTVGAKIEPHQVTFYWNGTSYYTVYSDVAYCPSSDDADNDGDTYATSTDSVPGGPDAGGPDSSTTHSVNSAGGADCPNLNMGSSFDFTAQPVKEILSLAGYQEPPQNEPNVAFDFDYIHVNSLS